ncbi:MAG: UPF0280 family protein [Spirochaetales bacterium]|nr:UPF0280 family protein [Spirochaetales bacterium]
MNSGRDFKTFTLHEAHFRITESAFAEAVMEIRRQRSILEGYLEEHPGFVKSLTPLPAAENAPEMVRRMTEAAAAVGVGPMAAVAGTFAHLAAQAAEAAGVKDIIVDNGGDLYMLLDRPAVTGIYSGGSFGPDMLAFLVTPEDTPASICSSSSTLGHSLSFGRCDLATVVSSDGALADAAATHLANLIQGPEDLEKSLETITSIPGIRGALAIIGDRIGAAGKLPRIIRVDPSALVNRVTRHPDSR